MSETLFRCNKCGWVFWGVSARKNDQAKKDHDVVCPGAENE